MIEGKLETVEQERSCSAASDLLFGHALNYAARVISVFPLQPQGKTPLTPRGFKDASIEPEQIHKWWTRWPDANIGVATGRLSDLAVLDVDGETGELSLLDLRHELPPTWCVMTGDGAHFYYRFPTRELRNSAGKLGPGLDVRGNGGYVVAPPSVHPNGATYRFIGARRKRAAWPDWLLPTQNEPLGPTESPGTYPGGVTPRSDRYAEAALAGEAATVRAAREGSRNDTLNKAAYAVARFFPESMSAREAADVLLAAALAVGLPESEARRTIASGFQGRGAA